jgi:hypothetical protein
VSRTVLYTSNCQCHPESHSFIERVGGKERLPTNAAGTDCASATALFRAKQATVPQLRSRSECQPQRETADDARPIGVVLVLFQQRYTSTPALVLARFVPDVRLGPVEMVDRPW